MSIPPAKASELKQIIHNQLLKIDIHGKMREILAENVRDSQGESRQSLSVNDLLLALQNRGVIDDVMRDIHFNQRAATDAQTEFLPNPAHQSVAQETAQLKKSAIDQSKHHLYLQVLGGKAFLEHLQEGEPLAGQVCSTFTLYLHFRNQRFRSKPVPCALEPDLEEGFLLDLNTAGIGERDTVGDATPLLSVSEPVHLVLIKTDTSGETTLVSSHFLDWRTVLSSPGGKTCFAVELMGVGSECKVPAGVLTVSLELYPPLVQILSADVIQTQQSLERTRKAERERLFQYYAKQWWKEFLEIRQSHQSRMVKIFAQDENGINRPACSYVSVLRAGRVLETPRQAARFVSLLGHERAAVVGGGVGKQEQWCTLMAFLCRKKGDCEDHATLLCSLLLGFGLDAFVCVGTKTNGVAHTWVLTRGTDGSITFWESLTAHRYLHQTIDPDAGPLAPKPKPSYPYRTVGCVFNHQTFLANCQPSTAVELCVFDFQNPSYWKAMCEDALKSVCAPGSAVSQSPQLSLTAPSLDSTACSNQLELEMRFLITEHRKDLELTTVWDDHLSYLLSSALSAYELERCTGVSCGNEEFQDAVRRLVPEGQTFKGFPIHFLHRNARRAFATCLKSTFCQEIVSCRGDNVRLAVRVRVFVYPENACAVWIMFACKYRSVL